MLDTTRRHRSELPVSLDEHRMLNTRQMAEAMGYCPTHLRRLVKAGKFPRPVQIGGRFRWPLSVLVKIARGASEGGEPKAITPPPTSTIVDPGESAHHQHDDEGRHGHE